VALRGEQWERLKSKHREKSSHREEGETDQQMLQAQLSEKKWQYAGRSFRTNSLKEGEM
jgi:hypothetical protein